MFLIRGFVFTYEEFAIGNDWSGELSARTAEETPDRSKA
jgi:hypothetical protein